MKFSALRKIRIFFDHFFELLGRIVRIVEASVLILKNIIVIFICFPEQFTVLYFLCPLSLYASPNSSRFFISSALRCSKILT